jgi:pyruvate dehydrogenase E1 component alpha subunit
MPTITHDGLLRGEGIPQVSLDGVPAEIAQALYRVMLRLRRCQEALVREYHPADEMRCPVHFCIGQEAAPVGLSLLLRPTDYLFSHHRSHGYFLAKGSPMKALFAELYGRATGANGGRAGSMDLSYADTRFYGGAILTGAVAIAVGAAFAEHLRGSESVSVAGFGEAATEEGIFWEAVNFAVLKRLPLVFVCENNRYSTFSPLHKRMPADNLHDRVAAFGMTSHAVFGNDAVGVYRTLAAAMAAARRKRGPTFIEAYTYRWNGHVGPEGDDDVGYRPEQELRYWQAHCPVRLLGEALRRAGLLNPAAEASWVREIDAEIAAAFAFAKASPFPAIDDWRDANYTPHAPLADRLLHDVEAGGFDQYQAEAIPGPY